jgi:predicted nucleic acid-binding protein
MIVVVDASILVAELLRKRGRELFGHPELICVVAEEQWSEAEHEIDKRLGVLADRGVFSPEQVGRLREDIRSLIENHVLAVIPNDVYKARETEARRRIPRDPADWPTVALALELDAAILTGDNDFLGCGSPTWTVETLLAELAQGPA